MEKTRTKRRIEHWHKIALLLALYDLVAVNLAYFLALWFRFDCAFSQIPDQYLTNYLYFAPINSVVCIVTFVVLRMYKSIWRFASYTELIRTIMATAISACLHFVLSWVILGRFPFSYYIIGTGLQFIFTLGIRFSYRFVLLRRKQRAQTSRSAKRAMLIGAGNAGQMILRDVNQLNRMHMQIVCIIDDNPNKWSRHIDGIPVVGGRDDIMASVEKYGVEVILVAVPSASADDKRDILNICKETGCQIKNLPAMEQLVSGQVSVGDMKSIAVEDLLGRKPITVDMREIFSQISGKVILVTGGGGSIGSELCRQIADHQPKQLIIFDVYENNAYDIQQELKERHPELNLRVLIGSVRDSRRLSSVFEKYRPHIVYHAAAHKHVPLMEDSPCESIKNNVIGTYKTAYAAMLYGCERFVLISTDKAVNPTNIMGASKRLCEMVIQSFDHALRTGTTHKLPELYTHYAQETVQMPAQQTQNTYKTQFVAVRFGNVLGSNGSVIPLFKKQIAKGGPVTVTHPDIIRYFMTIPEAVSLVLQAGAYAGSGEIYVLDMGAPVKIDELARNLIKLSGLKPDVDIPVVYSGLRPGEKLYEEKLMAEEGLRKTENSLIHIGKPIAFDTDLFLEQLRQLMEAAYENDENVIALVEKMVPTYHPTRVGEKDETFEELSRQTVCSH